MENSTKVSPEQRVGGMPCPVCLKFVPVSMRQLIHDVEVVCPHCGLRMSIDRPRSMQAIKALQKVEEAMEKVRKTESSGL